MTPQEFRDLPKLPWIEITYASAERQYAGQVARLMDKLANSTSKGAKRLSPKDFSWKLIYKRAPDPPDHITDPDEFLAQLKANSRAWLKASGKGWIGYEEIHTTPDKVLATYEQYSRLICSQRKAALNSPVKTENGEDYSDEWGNVEIDCGPVAALEEWLDRNPLHNKAVASVARLALVKLIEGDRR